MKFFKVSLLLLFLVLGLIAAYHTAGAQDTPPSGDDIVQGALLYDRWYAALNVDPPGATMPIWTRQTTNSRSGPDTWRCAECHGWDYRGAEGAYGSGSHYTGFPNAMRLAAETSIEDIVAHLKGAKDPAHDFSDYLNNKALTQLAVFLKHGTIDDDAYIDPVSLQVIDADIANGRQLYDDTCASCHGADGKTIVFRTEGVDEYLGSVANRDPWRFLHRTRFGTAGTDMPIGYTLNWIPEDGRDILAHTQTLPAGGALQPGEPGQSADTPLPRVPGGPASNLLTGILTGLGMFAGAVGYVLLFIGGFVVVGYLVVTILRRRK